MPTYTYENTETGETWEEFRSVSERLDGVDGTKIIQVPSFGTSKPYDSERDAKSKAHSQFQKNVLAPICENARGSYDSNM